MQINGVVVMIESNVAIAKQGGGSYTGTRFSYRDNTGALKEQAFHEKALKFNQSLAASLSNLKPGDTFTMVKEKEGEFWNVKGVYPAGAVPMSDAQTPAQNMGKSYSAPKSNYETPEERAARQIMIVRQSSISSAVAALKVDKTTLKVEDVLEMAKVFEAYVLGKGDFTSFSDLEDDLPD